jgi:hypothetical protein
VSSTTTDRSAPSPQPPAGDVPELAGEVDVDALFREARRRRRRRRLLALAGIVVLVAAAVGGVAVGRGSGHGGSGGGAPRGTPTAPKTGPASPSAQKPPGVTLPPSGYFNQIAATSSGLLLTGVTPATAGRTLPVCVSAAVDPHTLVVGPVRTGNCGDPRMFGQSIEVVNSPTLQTNNATISINSLSPAGQVVYGPVVMTYASESDTRPVTTSDGQWLWIYDNDTTKGPELLQISEQSGGVVDTIPVPSLERPLLAPDDGGVWIANSVAGASDPALFYVPSGSSAARVVVSSTDIPICWIVASGAGAWVGAGVQSCAKQDVQRFEDRSDTPVFSTAGTFVPFTVVGSQSDGLWSMQYVTPSKEAVVHIDPDTGTESVVATVPAVAVPSYLTNGGMVAGQGAYLDGRLYLLEPPFHKNGYLGYESIVGVDVSAVGPAPPA